MKKLDELKVGDPVKMFAISYSTKKQDIELQCTYKVVKITKNIITVEVQENKYLCRFRKSDGKEVCYGCRYIVSAL